MPTSPSVEPAGVNEASTFLPFVTGQDEVRALAKVSAISAWEAVIERYRLLARRQHSGAIHGLLVQSGEHTHLVDLGEGAGTLSVKVELPKELAIELPVRALLWGAWQVSESGWIWQVARAQSLPMASPSEFQPPEFEPGLLPQDKTPPEALSPASQASRSGGPISFVVQERGAQIGEGWLIADQVGGPPVARLLLPGERSPYGDQSLITEAERWKLLPKRSYWLEIGRFRAAKTNSLPVYHARSVPFHAPRPE